MPWNWTQSDCPIFRYDSAAIEPLERRFLLSSGEILGAVRHVAGEERDRLRIELLSEEAMRTSAIEGEVLDRSSVQSSLRRQFGLTADSAPSKPRVRGSKAASAPRITSPSPVHRVRPQPGICRISWRWARSAEPESGGIRGIGCCSNPNKTNSAISRP